MRNNSAKKMGSKMKKSAHKAKSRIEKGMDDMKSKDKRESTERRDI